ncbi:hypothetical protein HMSSN036_71310 [Paenibacillus macerans]|nr:hypothetical protein HMSSN036_71310 [Paenibacillus macerans]
MAARCQYRFRIVTLEGDVVNAGGSMTGGSQHRKNSNLLGRKRQLDQLAADIRESEEMLDKLRKGLADVRSQVAKSESDLNRLREAGDAKRAEEQAVAGDLKQAQHEWRHVSEQFELYGQEKGHYQKELEELEATKKAAEERLAELEKEEQSVQQSIRAAELPAKRANRRRKSCRTC